MVATDADGDFLTYRLASGPPGMTVDGLSGRVNWLTSIADAGLHPVGVTVDDPYGGQAVDAWDVDVVFDVALPW